MAKALTAQGLTFTQACERLGLAPADLVRLREQGLIACLQQQGRQVYPAAALDLTGQLLALGYSRGWTPATLAWYADLVFAAEVGRAILLPTTRLEAPLVAGPTSWL